MPNDAKLGMVVGVGLVIAIAVIFFRKEAPAVDPAAATIVKPAPAVTPVPPPANNSQTVAKRTGLTRGESGERRHTVEEGDTLFSLAKRYYGDGEQFIAIYRANRNVLQSPDRLPAGAVLVIPELPALTDGGKDKP